jgi:hypothetical protein
MQEAQESPVELRKSPSTKIANVSYMTGFENSKGIIDGVVSLCFNEDYLKAQREKNKAKSLTRGCP